jgi:hypothetical protein
MCCNIDKEGSHILGDIGNSVVPSLLVQSLLSPCFQVRRVISCFHGSGYSAFFWIGLVSLWLSECIVLCLAWIIMPELDQYLVLYMYETFK